MKTFNSAFQSENQKERKEPRFVVEIYGDTNTYYILSHADIVVPGVSDDYIIYSSYKKSSVFSQKLANIKSTSTIGGMSHEIVDLGKAFTNMLANIDALDESLRGRKMAYYHGYKGLAFNPGTDDDFIRVQVNTITGSLVHTGTGYTIEGKDIERSLIEKIFTPKQTTLKSSITRTAVQIPLVSTDELEMITHTAAYSDAPSETVGYIRIGDEVMRWTAKDDGTDYLTIDNETTTLNGATTVNATTLVLTDATNFPVVGSGFIDDTNDSEIKWTGKTSNTLTGVSGIKYAHSSGTTIYYSKGRGVFNTVPVEHEVDAGITDDDRKPKVTEWIYLEGPALHLALTVKTGTIYGTANTIPAHWSTQISVDWIATSTFDNIGTDIFDPTDPTKGFILRFEGLKTQEAKTWIQEQCYRPAMVFDYIQSDGQIAIKRMNEPLPDSPYVRKLDDSQLIKITNLRQDFDDTYTEFEILWNWNAITESFTRRILLVDEQSQTKHKKSKRLTINLYGLHGSRHTEAVIIQWLDSWRSRHSNPPWKADVQIFSLNQDLEIGDNVLIDTDNFRDFLGSDTSRFSNVMEVQRIASDPNTGALTASVFGAPERAPPLNLGSQASVLSSGYWTATGTSLAGETTYFTDVGGVLQLDTNGYTMTGATSINDTACHYYVDGDLTINAGIIGSFTHNVLLKVNGHLTIDGGLSGVGAGLAGVAYSGTGVSGTTGFFGITKGGGGINVQSQIYSPNYTFTNIDAPQAIPVNDNPPRLNLVNNAGTLEINQNDLRPSSGGSGRQSKFITQRDGTTSIAGGDGGDGGASLVIVCKSMSFGSNGYIDTSGTEGTSGSSYNEGNINYYYGGKGSSGHPGAVWVLLAGNTIDPPSNKLIANYNSSRGPGHTPENGIVNMDSVRGAFSSNLYNDLTPRNQSCFIVQRIPDNETAAEDVSPVATVSSAINISPISGNLNVINATVYEITTTAPSDTNWKADAVYYKKSSATDWTRLGTTNGSNELILYAGAGLGTLDVKAHPISKSTNQESPDYIETTLTVAASVVTALGTDGQLLIGSATDYFTGNGIALVDDAGTAKAHMGNPAGQYWRWTGTQLDVKGNITADTISAPSGTVGGWTLSPSDFSAGSGATTVGLDSGGSNPAIYAGSATPGSAPFRVTNAGALTASNATIAGSITANTLTANTAGNVGGWSITPGLLEYDSGGSGVISLDASNERIRLEDNAGTSYFDLSIANGIIGVDATLGTVLNIPLDGSAPTFASGIINTTVFNISTSGIMRTSDTVGDGPGSSSGVLINDTGIKLFPSGSSTPNVHLDATDGSIAIYDWNNATDPTKIEGSEIYANTITATQIAAGTITASEIAAGTITADRLNVSTLSAISANLGTITAGTIQAVDLYTATSGKRIELNPSADNELHFYGDRGDTTIEELATIGISTEGGDTVVANFGTSSSGTSRIAVYAQSYANRAIYAYSYSNYGVHGTSNVGVGVYAYSTSDIALLATGNSNIGAQIRTNGTTHGPLKIYPKSNTTDPTTGSIGEFYVRSDGVLRFHNGTSWGTVTVT